MSERQKIIHHILFDIAKTDSSHKETHELLYNLSEIDYTNKFMKKVLKHGLGGLLLHKIDAHKTASFSIKEQYINRLKKRYHKTILKNTKNYAELKKAKKALHQCSIEPILLKGIFLCKWLYDDIGLRPMGDMDILIKNEQLKKTTEILQELGWEVVDKSNMFKCVTYENVDQKTTHQPISLKKGKLLIELHTTIHNKLKPYNVNLHELFKNTQSIELFGNTFSTLSIEHTLLHLCLHSYEDSRGHGLKLKNLNDIFLFLERHDSDIDWKQFYDRCKEYNCFFSAKCSLLLVHRVFSSPINGDFSTLNWRYKLYEKIVLSSLENGKLYTITKTFRAYNSRIGRIAKGETLPEKLAMLFSELFPAISYTIYQNKRYGKYVLHLKLYKALGYLKTCVIGY